jgi:hypothetical protein
MRRIMSRHSSSGDEVIDGIDECIFSFKKRTILYHPCVHTSMVAWIDRAEPPHIDVISEEII